MLLHYVCKDSFGDFSVSNNVSIISNLIICDAFRASFIGMFIIAQPVASGDAPRL